MNIRPYLPLLLALAVLPFPLPTLRGQEINGTCAACHGEFGQGQERRYPRLAGQRPGYIMDQLKSFRSRARINIPMFPYTQGANCPMRIFRDVAEYLASIELPTKMPSFRGDGDALTRLFDGRQGDDHSASGGDVDSGGAVYQKNCVTCHAKTGLGRGKVSPCWWANTRTTSSARSTPI